MNRIKNEPYHGAAGYDAVARRKIKELEEKVGTGGGSGGGNMVEYVLFDKVVIFEPMDGSTDPDAPVFWNTRGAIAFVDGVTYKVKWDGKEYNCAAYELDMNGISAVLIGNGSIIEGFPGGNLPDTGEPFVIMANPEAGTNFFAKTSTDQNIKISLIVEIPDSNTLVVKDRKYMILFDNSNVTDEGYYFSLPYHIVEASIMAGKPLNALLMKGDQDSGGRTVITIPLKAMSAAKKFDVGSFFSIGFKFNDDGGTYIAWKNPFWGGGE